MRVERLISHECVSADFILNVRNDQKDFKAPADSGRK